MDKEKMFERFEMAVQEYHDHGAAAGLIAKQELRDEIGDEAMADVAAEYKKRKGMQ